MPEDDKPIGVTPCNVPIVEWFLLLELSWKVEGTIDKKRLVAPPQSDILSVLPLLNFDDDLAAYKALLMMIKTAIHEYK